MDGSASALGRRCEGCGEPLSRYNPADRCQACVSAAAAQQPGQSGELPPVGKRLARLRRERGLTQEELAERAGVSADIVRKLEQGARASARLATLAALARALGARTGELFQSPPGVRQGERVSPYLPEVAERDGSFAALLRELLAARGFSHRAFARSVPCNRSYVSMLATGQRLPSPGMVARIDEVLDAGGQLITSAEEARSGRQPVGNKNPNDLLNQDRRVIQALAVIGSDNLGSVADSVGQLVDHYEQTICALPPVEVYDELLSVRAYASRIVERAGLAPQRKDLIVATGWLSNLLALAACDIGEHAAARVWCSDAEHRGQDVRHPELAAWAVLTRAMIAFYQGQAQHSVSLAAQGQKITAIGTVIHAKLAAQEMRAVAMAGDAANMARARIYAAKAIARLPSGGKTTGAFSIKLGEDPPYTATSLLFVGNFNDAVSATERVIQTVYQPRKRNEDPSGYARSLLILALAQAGAGQLDEAVAAGHAALACSRPAWPTIVLAGKLDQILSQNWAGSREITEYHDRYLAATGQPRGHHLQLPARTEDS